MRKDINVEPTDIGIYAIKKGTGKTFHFFPYAEGEVEVLTSIPACLCGDYVFDPHEFSVASGQPAENTLNKRCYRKAVRLADQVEEAQVNEIRDKLLLISKEIMDIVESAISTSIILCDEVLMESLIEAYKMAVARRFVELSHEYELKGVFDEVLVATSTGEIHKFNEIFEFAKVKKDMS